MTYAEFRQTLACRRTRRPAISFLEFVCQQGYGDSDLLTAEEYADFIGGALKSHTVHSKGKHRSLTSRIAAKIELSERLHREYEAAIQRGEIPIEEVETPLSDSEADTAYVRALHKRALRKALEEGAPISASARLEYPELFHKG